MGWGILGDVAAGIIGGPVAATSLLSGRSAQLGYNAATDPAGTLKDATDIGLGGDEFKYGENDNSPQAQRQREQAATKAKLDEAHEQTGIMAAGSRIAANDAQRRQAAAGDWGLQNTAMAQGASDWERQRDLANMYGGVLAGSAPSVAQQQLMQARDANARTALAMAASTRGTGAQRASASAAAQDMLGRSNLETQQQAALLRAKEQEMARQGLGGLLGQMRGQDYQAAGLYGDQAKADLEAELRQRGMNDAMSGQYLDLYQAGTLGNMNAYGAEYGAQLGQQMDYEKLRQAQRQAEAERQDKYMMALFSALGSGLSAGGKL